MNISYNVYMKKGMYMIVAADDFYSVMSHPMRLRAVMLLYQHEELCVCELMHALDEQQPVISRHLGQLKSSGLLESRKQGQWVYYRINKNLPDWVQHVLLETVKGISQQQPYKNDTKQLNTMKDRPLQACN